MLLGLDPLLGPDLLYALAAMGHGDPDRAGRRQLSCHAQAPPDPSAGSFDAARPAGRAVGISDRHLHRRTVRRDAGRGRARCAAAGGRRDECGAGQARPRRRRASSATRSMWLPRALYAIVQTGERRFYGNILLTRASLHRRNRHERLQSARSPRRRQRTFGQSGHGRAGRGRRRLPGRSLGRRHSPLRYRASLRRRIGGTPAGNAARPPA